MDPKRWEVISKTVLKNNELDSIENILLENRGLNTKVKKEEFLKPKDPMKIEIKETGIKTSEITKALKRIQRAKENKEKVIVYGDYDADGVCATAILWETLYNNGLDALPYIPERFSEGYGLNKESIQKLKDENPGLKLIITVDHGIVANEQVKFAKKLGVEVIISDHHQPGKKLPKPLALIHTTKIGGAAVSWFFSKEIAKTFKKSLKETEEKLELAAIGTIADQLPLISINRSLVKFGLEKFRSTNRVGLKELCKVSQVKYEEIATYEIGFIIAPRINAMGRLEHAIESLRLLCTKDSKKAEILALHLNKVNFERQQVVEEVVLHAKDQMKNKELKKIIILAHESYHEGVIGLAAARLVESFYRPAIVLSKKKNKSKASARSIPGFNIIEAIRTQKKFLLEGGGHPMAAGFSLKTSDLKEFTQEFEKKIEKILSDDLLTKTIKVDLEINFENLDYKLLNVIKKFEPSGLGNPTPVLLTKEVLVVEDKILGKDKKHLKLKLQKDEKRFDAIAFGFSDFAKKLKKDSKVDLVFNLDENVWNGRKNLQLKIKDLKLSLS